MGARDGEDGAGGSADPSGSTPEIPAEEATTIDLSLAGALTPEELRQLEQPAPPREEEKTVAEPIPPHLISEPPPKIDPDATFKLPPERSEIIVLPGRSATATILLLASGVALLAALVTLGIVFGSQSWKSDRELVVAGGAGGGDASAADASAADAAEPEVPDAAEASLDARAGDSGPDADVEVDGGDAALAGAHRADAGFVIEEPEIPPAVRRMSRRARARRARRQRRAALRLHGRMRYERAEEAWRRALVLQPENRHTHAGLARTLRALERDAEADAWQARAEAASPMRRRRRRRRR